MVWTDLQAQNPENVLSDSLKSGIILLNRDSVFAEREFESEINYSADDSIVGNLGEESILLYGNAKVTYEDVILKAGVIRIDYGTGTMMAYGSGDSLNPTKGQPVFEEGGETYYAEKIMYNYKTKKGKIVYGRTAQNGDVIIGDSIKRNPDESFYIRKGKFTTCDHTPPHFYIESSKMKVIPQDRVVSGPLKMVIEGISLPIILPFGFFPNQPGKKSGILIPAYGEDAQRGFFLREGGYYWAVNDFMDLIFQGDIFSKGSYRVSVASNYKVRYKFDGRIDLQYALQKKGEKYDSDYSESRDFFIRWNHNQQVSRGGRFTASVNAGSSNFLNYNSYNTQDILTNTLLSNISFTKSIPNSGWSYAIKLGHNQNLSTHAIALELPTVSVNKARAYPFKKENQTGAERWYEKIGYSYSLNGVNRINTIDSVLFSPASPDKFQNGIKHAIPVSTNLKALKYLTISPALDYAEFWYFQTLEKTWQENQVVSDTIPGFATARTFGMGATMTTKIYGLLQFKSARQRAFRHTITPELNYSYRPDFSEPSWGYYRKVQSDTLGTESLYSRFATGVLGGPGAGTSQTLSFRLYNLLEMKALGKIKSDTAKPTFVKSTLLDNLGFNSSYNFAADSFKLAPFQLSARTVLINNLLNINLTGVLNPYILNQESGIRNDIYEINETGKLGTFTQAGIAISTSLKSRKKEQTKTETIDPSVLREIDKIRMSYVDFSLPWNVNLSYNLDYTKPQNIESIRQSIQATGDLNVTSKWKVGMSTGYDFTNKQMTFTNITVYRDLHCWEMSFSWIPFGPRQSYNLAINVKSQTLRDLRLTKRRDWNRF